MCAHVVQLRSIFKQLTKEKGCQPWKAQVPLLSQIPLWIVLLFGWFLLLFDVFSMV
jgi:hypothetical protein